MSHGARLTIDLGALARNWRRLGARAGTEAAGVVKADAYGCGIEQVAPALARAGCRTFFVAHLLEGLRARAAAPEADIYVLNGLPPSSAPATAEARLRPVLGSLAEIADWPGGPAALHVDTGLNRLGLDPGEMSNLPAGFRPTLLLSHFVASEEPDEPVNARQIEAFRQVRAMSPETPASLCNSSGIYLDNAAIGFDMVRPGYALYGGNPTPWTTNPMEPVVRLDATILQIRDVPAGATVGYGSTWTATSPRRIATVSIGYADGWSRAASNPSPAGSSGGAALVEGVLCPVVGRVSMDLTALDVTEAPAARRGALATFLGDALDLETVGRGRATNGYEVLTSLGARYERVYRGD